MKKKTWRIAGINFDHFHMGDLLRMAVEHPQAEVYRECLEKARPDIVILCPAASKHGEWVKKIAPRGAHIMVEKPFAASLREADAMVQAMPKGRTLMINWPLQWVRAHRKAYELIEAGVIGHLLNVWHFGGNRGPLWHGADKVVKTADQVASEKPRSWFYKKAHGGGSLLDYLGYGTTLGTLGHVHRSLGHTAAAQMRLRDRGHRRHDQQLRLRRLRYGPDAQETGDPSGRGAIREGAP